MTDYYAGIGSRQTPMNTLIMMREAATSLEIMGFKLRSGGAAGADSAFEQGVTNPDNMDIYLPWSSFNKNPSSLSVISGEAFVMASQFHPAWERCSVAARKFHARNCYQVLGFTLDVPAMFVICWTPGGAITGGTGQALRIAQHHNIPIINLGDGDWKLDDIIQAVEGIHMSADQASITKHVPF